MEKGSSPIYLFGYEFNEPTTVITNIIITVLALIYFFKLKSQEEKQYILNWRLFFLFLGLSAFLGGIGHAIHEQHGKTLFNVIWMCMNICSLISAFFCFRASLFFTTKNPAFVTKINFILYGWIGIVIALTVIFNHFLIIKINSGLFILYTLVRHIITTSKGAPGSKWIVTGFGISLLSILVHSFKISAHEFFNFKDISHVIMWISIFCLYKGLKIKAQSDWHITTATA